MRWMFRIVFLLGVFAAVGWMAEHLILERAHVRTPGYGPETLLAAHAAGLFAGGLATVIVAIALFAFGPKPPVD